MAFIESIPSYSFHRIAVSIVSDRRRQGDVPCGFGKSLPVTVSWASQFHIAVVGINDVVVQGLPGLANRAEIIRSVHFRRSHHTQQQDEQGDTQRLFQS